MSRGSHRKRREISEVTVTGMDSTPVSVPIQHEDGEPPEWVEVTDAKDLPQDPVERELLQRAAADLQKSVYTGPVEPVVVDTPPAPDNYFGTFWDFLKNMPAHGSSEFATGPALFGLAVSINAKTVIEIGRFTGFSTVALAGALRFLDGAEWRIPDCQYQRPDVNYDEFLAPARRELISIDLNPNFAAELAVKAADLDGYVKYVNADSHTLELGDVVADLIFIDGDHTYGGCLEDVEKYTGRYLRPGGYYVLHDYYGWYNERGENGSAIKQVADLIGKQHQHILIDTGFMSLVMFRKPN